MKEFSREEIADFFQKRAFLRPSDYGEISRLQILDVRRMQLSFYMHGWLYAFDIRESVTNEDYEGLSDEELECHIPDTEYTH